MNKPSKAFAEKLVKLCMDNGVQITENEDYDDGKLAGIRYQFESADGVLLGAADVKKALDKAKK